ncbi:hypothetical protein ONZ45_g17906 [Pleurotus djamor]|nr:hypothetical protein ONZ45_g17906 [Pleurotus djamor]
MGRVTKKKRKRKRKRKRKNLVEEADQDIDADDDNGADSPPRQTFPSHIFRGFKPIRIRRPTLRNIKAHGIQYPDSPASPLPSPPRLPTSNSSHPSKPSPASLPYI